jgi:hypothetical protein
VPTEKNGIVGKNILYIREKPIYDIVQFVGRFGSTLISA